MKQSITLIIFSFLFLNCIFYKNDFEITLTFYNKDDVQRNEFKYNSHTGILLRQFEKVGIVFNENEKQDINEYFKTLKLKNNSACEKLKDGTSLKINIVFENSEMQDSKCITEAIQVEKYLLLYARIRQQLSTKEEYKKAFPGEFEVY